MTMESSAESPGGASPVRQNPSTPPAATAQPKLFDTISRFSHYVIFHDALMKVKQKIQLGTLASSYDIVDMSEDHKEVLLNLPGRIGFENFYDLYAHPDEKLTYAVANARLGITFNSDIVIQSHLFYEARGFTSVEDALKTLDGLSYSAVLQETFEHELAHLKIRRDFLQHHGLVETPEGPPLHMESGFAVQQNIRANRNGNKQVEASGFNVGREEDTERILEVPTVVQLAGYRAPLQLVWGSFRVRNLTLTSVAGRGPITLEQLKEHMTYGGMVDPTSKFCLDVPTPTAGRLTAAPPSGRQSKKRDRDGNDSQDCGGKSVDRRRSPATALFQSKLASAPADMGKLKASVASVSAANKQKGANEDNPEEPLHQLYRSLLEEQKWDLLETGSYATLDVTFEDMNGSCREYFLPSEPVYVTLKFSNPTENNVCVVLARKNFARGGIHANIEGCVIRNRLTNRAPMVVAKLAPSESHIFHHRKLCGGPKPESKEEEDMHSYNAEMVPYWTPTKPATYMVTFSMWKGQFPLVIRDGEDGKYP